MAATWTAPPSPPSRWLDPTMPDGFSLVNGCVRGMEGPQAPWSCHGGLKQPQGAKEVLTAWWLFSSSTPGVGGHPGTKEGCPQVSAPTLGVLCDLKPNNGHLSECCSAVGG